MDLDLRHAGARVRSLKVHVNWLRSSMAVEKRRFNAKPTLELKIVESLEDVVLDEFSEVYDRSFVDLRPRSGEETGEFCFRL